MSTSTPTCWRVVLPVKRRQSSKTRLGMHDAARQALTLAFATDTMRAILACSEVEQLVVVTEDQAVATLATGLGATLVAERHESGVHGFDRLNAAVGQGAAAAGLPDGPVVALTADLPALRPAELSAALALAAHHDRAFVADHTGSGTSMVASLRASALRPRFGVRSAAAHARSGFTRLVVDAPGLRLDVDTPEDLRYALALGCGEATTALLTSAPQTGAS